MLGNLIVNDGAYIYVSGRAKLMPKSVEKAFTEVIDKFLQENPKDFIKSGKDAISFMKKQRRYQ
jgi:sulfite reductase alpha subunit-like flavoprotein